MIQFSQAHGCYVFTCEWGCFGLDYESELEAQRAYIDHECRCST